MSFRVSARTLLHLGAELISSDSVALFELVKNAFDAGSERVTISVVVRVHFPQLRQLRERISLMNGADRAPSNRALEALRSDLAGAIDRRAPRSRSFARSVSQAKTLQDLSSQIEEANYLRIRDSGEGMSLDTLNSVFLTIGTRSRLVTRTRRGKNGSGRPVLGEKGVGRLSAMRLGRRLRVQSTTVGEPTWNVLDIDWSVFSHDSDALLDTFQIEAKTGEPKDDPSSSGTVLIISGLTSGWSKERLQALAQQEFTKLTDPFTDHTVFPVRLLYNRQPVSIPRFKNILLANAHATVNVHFAAQSDGLKRLFGTVQYKGRESAFSLDGPHLISSSDASVHALDSLGPFSLEVYWYNRRILTAVDGIGDRRMVLDLVREWGGGIMVFRDGFRVLPYGGPDDDWLDLDRRALGSGGYKINRAQIIGRLQITNMENPALTDQTNREGLRDCEDKEALVALLRHVIQDQLRPFLNTVDAEIKAREPIYIEELERRVEEEEEQIRENIIKLIANVPEMGREQTLIDGIMEAVERLSGLMTDVRELAASYQAGREQLLNLAGIGLTVEVLAHELNRATEHVIQTLADFSSDDESGSLGTTVRLLDAQLNTLHKRLRVLDPLSVSGRQRKERFDVTEVARDVIEDHRDRFAREGIACKLVVGPPTGRGKLPIKAVRGMIIQVLGNLLDNSIYWLRQQKKITPDQRSEIVVSVETVSKEVSVTDNGPGVPSDQCDRIFEAFVTTKPAGQGKGLGLFIGREIARYHGADLLLANPTHERDDSCHTFVLTLEGMM